MFDKDTLFNPRPVTGMFPPEKPRYTMTEEIEHTAREMRNTIDRLLKFEKRMEEEINDRMRNVTQDNVIFKDTFNTAFQTFLQQVKNEVNAFESNVDATITMFQGNVESDYATLSEDVKRQVAEALAQYSETVSELEKGFETAVSDAVSEFTAKADELSERINASLEHTDDESATLNARVDELRAYVNEQDTDIRADIAEHKEAVMDMYDSHEQAVNERIDLNNSTMSQAFTDYQQKLTTEINSFEASVNTTWNEFAESLNESNQLFRETLDTVINDRLNAQDARISDAELYMKSNLVGTVNQQIGDMVADGTIAEIIGGEVVDDLKNTMAEEIVTMTEEVEASMNAKVEEVNTNITQQNESIASQLAAQNQSVTEQLATQNQNVTEQLNNKANIIKVVQIGTNIELSTASLTKFDEPLTTKCPDLSSIYNIEYIQVDNTIYQKCVDYPNSNYVTFMTIVFDTNELYFRRLELKNGSIMMCDEFTIDADGFSKYETGRSITASKLKIAYR